MAANAYDYLIKIVIVGDGGVGKSSLVNRMTNDQFNEEHLTTIGIDFAVKTVRWNNKIVKVQLWDTAGDPRFRGIASSYYRGAHAVWVVFDQTNRMSFLNVARWLHEVHQYASESIELCLIANKSDRQDDIVVDEKEIRTLAHKNKVDVLFTSAKTGKGVEAMVNDMIGRVVGSTASVSSNGIQLKAPVEREYADHTCSHDRVCCPIQ